MANKKITDLTDIGTPANDDLLEIVDVSDLTDSPEGTSKKVLVSALGGGSTPTLQDVRDIDPNVTVENPNDANNVGLWNSLQYNEYALRVEDGLLIETLSGNVQQVTSRFSDSATIQIQGSIYDSVTEDSLQSTLGVEQGKAIILEIINDSTLNQGSHKIELDPAIGEEVIFKTPNDATTGTETIATREWVNSNLPTIDATPTDGSSNAVSSNGVFDALALKTNTTVATTGVDIFFVTPQIYNTSFSPATANITNNLTGANLGIIQKIYHNHSVAPTVPGGWVLIGGEYKISELNIIYAEWCGSSRVEYWITQEV